MYNKYPQVTEEEREELAWRVYEGDDSVRERFIACNMPLVISIARRYSNNGILPDLIQEGSKGLMRAAEKFDPTRGYKFSTYATWWVRQKIFSYIKKQAPIRQSSNTNAAISRTDRIANEFMQHEGREPTEEELAEELDIDVRKLEELKKLNARRFFSLDQMIGDGNTERGELFGYDPWEEEIDQINQGYVRRELENYLQKLSAEQQTILRHRFYDGLPTPKIAEKTGMSNEKVKQTEATALRILRAMSRTDPGLRNLLEYV